MIVPLKRGIEIPGYSIHDARIQKFKVIDNNQDERLIVQLDYAFEYNEEGFVRDVPKAKIIFENVDFDSCYVTVFNKTVVAGKKFKGKQYLLKDFIKKFKKYEFEIINESYNYFIAVWSGWLWDKKGRPQDCTIQITNFGEVLYQISE